MENLQPLLVGKVSGLFGTRGWIKIFSYTRPRGNLLLYPQLLVGKDFVARRMVDTKQHGNKLLAQLGGIDDRDAAAALIGTELFIDRQWLETTAEDTFYWADLIGLQVVNQTKLVLGKVSNVLETGANDVLQVSGERERLIPFVLNTYITAVDLENGIIEVDWHPED